MCGIAGIVDLVGSRQPDQELVTRMTNRLQHRGPDGSGFHFEPGVGFGHRRLSIIDLAGGAQPMYNEDQSVVLTYNGEIYDFHDLIDELEALGHRFSTVCDTEVIVHAWEEWGAGCLDRLHGMFAFAIWDRNTRKLFLARDRFGKKPLYYAILNGGTLVFASELKSLLVNPMVPREILPQAVKDYMTFGYVPDPKTIFRDVLKLPPGHCLEFKIGETSAKPRQYWDIDFSLQASTHSEDEVCEELRSRLAAATKRRMVSDVPLGAFLSGGVDSSAIVAEMAEASGEPVNTCSISFGDPKFNESRYAQMIANRFGTDHHVENVDVDDFALVEHVAEIYDEPFADSSALPTYRVCELARKHVTVALSGDGGDEVFAGYRRYRWHMNEERARRLVPGFARRGLFGLAGRIYPKMDWAPRPFRAKSTLQAIARESADAYLHSVSILPNDLHDRLFSENFRKRLQGYESIDVFREHIQNCDTDDRLALIQYIDMKTYLPGDILTKVDRASMAHGLEVRVPILDSDFASWVCTLPSSLKLRHGEGKYIFKRALENAIPRDILYRPKMGFAVPLASWFRGPLKSRIHKRLLEGSLAETDLFDQKFVSQLLEQHCSGVRDFSPPIWALLVFERFYSTYCAA